MIAEILYNLMSWGPLLTEILIEFLTEWLIELVASIITATAAFFGLRRNA